MIKNFPRMIFFGAALSLAILIEAGAAVQEPVRIPVRVAEGRLAGAATGTPGVEVYRGVPYAAPPTGDLRWKPPQPAAPWKGVRQATAFSPTCIQMPGALNATVYHGLHPTLPQSEDCLYLNVWTAAKSYAEHLPVMVWIHGGGFTMSAGSQVGFNGEHLAAKGVVVVTINYRLGVFGFFALPELTAESPHRASGNYGLMDQIAALEWVKKNIAVFGGDPGNVTIFGQSAGSFAVNLLTASPLAKGLFQRAIGESGANFSEALRAGSTGRNAAELPPMIALADEERSGEKVVSELGLTGNPLKALRAAPVEKLVKASRGLSSWAIVDGWVMPQDVATIYSQGKQNDVTTIAGNNSDEGSIYLFGSERIGKITAAAYAMDAQQKYGALCDRFMQAYPGSTDAQAVASTYAAFRDERFGWEMRNWARMQTKTGRKPVYRYYFSHRPPGPEGEQLGAFHTSEIPYVFGNFDMYDFPWTEADRKLSETMMRYWTNFAKTGNPNGPDLPDWPAYNADQDDVLEFGAKVSVQRHLNQAGLDFFEAYHALLPPSP